MAPSRVDPNKKQAKSSIYQVEQDSFYLDRMARTVYSFLSQATVNYAQKTPRVFYYECLDDGEAQQIQTSNLFYKINMQEQYAVVRATVLQYMLTVAIPKNTSLPCSNLEEKSDGPRPSPKKTDATETKIDESLQNFIETLPFLNLFSMDLSFKGPIKVDIAFVLLQKWSVPKINFMFVIHKHLPGSYRQT
jgi:hypothetical protein